MIMDGILVINKPAGYTSHDCIAVLRGVTGIRKLGHTGTLDPNATGVLPVCAGKATKLIEYMDDTEKSYICGIKFGLVTRTQDIWGEIVRDNTEALKSDAYGISFESVSNALKSFEGEIEQVPPAFSAVFVNGRRAYDIARRGGQPELKARKVTISKIRLLDLDEAAMEGHIEVCCSRGTYVRTICHDLGQLLGCGACLSSLVRTSACGFTLDEALDLEEARTMDRDAVLARMLPIKRAIFGMPEIYLDIEEINSYLNGMTLKKDPCGYPQQKPLAVFGGQELLGISQFIRDSLKPIKVFS